MATSEDVKQQEQRPQTPSTKTVKLKIPIDTDKLAKIKKTKASTKKSKGKRGAAGATAFPKHSINKCLRIPQGVLEQHAGKECTDKEAAKYAGLGYNGDIGVEISSAIKYGLLERPAPGTVKPTELVRKIVRPQKTGDKTDALRAAILNAPVIADVYKNYRGENLPDHQFLINTVVDTFKVPGDRAEAFVSIFTESLKDASLVEDMGNGKLRVLDITHRADATSQAADDHLKKLSKGVDVVATDTCFVMQPFAAPLGAYYATVYEPAIKKAGLTAVRADAEIFGTGKIIDQIWQGINSARILVAELTTRNANVFYELGLAHALRKPVVLVSSNEDDVPFDIRHVRVVYYDVTDPFWGAKLVDKIAEKIMSALKDPKDAILFPK
jgi:hypothetical protein